MSTTQAPSRERIAVVGAGVTGLTAAFELSRAGVEVVVLEASDRPGGKVDAVEIAGLRVDSGPDGFLARDPAAAELCHRLGLGPELVAPASSEAYVWVDRGLRPLPRPSVLGAPLDASTVAGTGIVSAEGLDGLRRGLKWDAPALAGDATVGEVLRPRVGDEVFEHLVDPLLGGINAGSADRMSIEASAAPLYEAARKGGPFGAALNPAGEPTIQRWGKHRLCASVPGRAGRNGPRHRRPLSRAGRGRAPVHAGGGADPSNEGTGDAAGMDGRHGHGVLRGRRRDPGRARLGDGPPAGGPRARAAAVSAASSTPTWCWRSSLRGPSRHASPSREAASWCPEARDC